MHLQFDLLGSKAVFGPYSGNEKKPQPTQQLPTWLTCASQLKVELRAKYCQYPLKIFALQQQNWINCKNFLIYKNLELPPFSFVKTRQDFKFNQIVLCCSRKWSRKVLNCQNGQKRFLLELWRLWLFHDLIFYGCLGFEILSGNGLIGTACNLFGSCQCVSACLNM